MQTLTQPPGRQRHRGPSCPPGERHVTATAAGVSAVELRDLWARFNRDGDRRARERLLLTYAPLVKYVAGRMASALPAHVDEADLVSYGLCGLVSALDRFDPGRDRRFESYALARIRGAILDELRSQDWAPRSLRARARDIERASARLEHKLGRTPTEAELAAEVGISAAELGETLVSLSQSAVLALDAELGSAERSGEPTTLLQSLPDPQACDPAELVDAGELRDRIASAIARLPERERLVIALYYYENLNLREIGEVIGLTESRVSQLRTAAVLRLRGAAGELQLH